MKFLEKLEKLMENNHIENLHSLSKKAKIPYSTLRGFYSKGTENIKRTTLITLAKFFNCSIDYLVDDEILEITPYGNGILNEKDIDIFEKILQKQGLLKEGEILTDEKLNNIIEILNANKKFILFSDER